MKSNDQLLADFEEACARFWSGKERQLDSLYDQQKPFRAAILSRMVGPSGHENQGTAMCVGYLPPGWRIVPEDPTEEMITASCMTVTQGRIRWAAMLAAAPTPPAAAEEKHDG